MNKQQQRSSTLLMALVVSLLLIITIESVNIISVYASPVITVPTRGIFNTFTGQENAVHRPPPTAADVLGQLDQICPGEIAIYVHGVWADQQSALEQVERVDISLGQGNNYDVPVVGFSWDSDTSVNLDGWQVAKVIANQNGKLLADLIVDYKGECPNDEVRLIAHSLGSRVILSALQSLHDESRGSIVRSVHLMGAAVDDEQVSTDDSLCLSNLPPPLPCSGRAIESTVQTKLYNLHNYEDNFLHRGLGYTEDFALGLYGSSGSEPNNYEEYSVLSRIPPILNADGNLSTDCRDSTIGVFSWSSSFGFNDGWGDNHCGYMGFRTLPFSDPYKDGAIEDVVIDWRNNP